MLLCCNPFISSNVQSINPEIIVNVRASQSLGGLNFNVFYKLCHIARFSNDRLNVVTQTSCFAKRKHLVCQSLIERCDTLLLVFINNLFALISKLGKVSCLSWSSGRLFGFLDINNQRSSRCSKLACTRRNSCKVSIPRILEQFSIFDCCQVIAIDIKRRLFVPVGSKQFDSRHFIRIENNSLIVSKTNQIRKFQIVHLFIYMLPIIRVLLARNKDSSFDTSFLILRDGFQNLVRICFAL